MENSSLMRTAVEREWGYSQEPQHHLGAHLGKYHSGFRLYAKNSGEDIKEFFIRKCKIYVSSISLLLPSRSWIIGEEIRCGVISEAIANIQAEVAG